jgi:membrane associated rhomboid family serine protease
VSDIDTRPFCAFHSDRRAGVVCQRCDKPICPACMHQASVGFHCPDCAKQGKQKVVRGKAAFGRNPSATPLTFVLIAINIVVFVYEVSQGTSRGEYVVNIDYGLNADFISQNGEWYRIITAGFLHASLIHLGLNMWALYVLGPLVERSLGRLRFGIVYGAALIAGSAGALIIDPHALTVGASGAIYGLLGALVILFRNRGISVWQSGLGITILINAVITVAIPGISWGGHLGGFVGGLLVTLVLVEGPKYVRNRDALVWIAGALIPVFFAISLAAASAGA